jgi:hypothetical protein
MTKPLEDLFEDKARAGDGLYAIALGLLKLSNEQERLTKKVGQLGFDGPGGNMGAFEYIGVKLGGIAEQLNCLTINASISGSVDTSND